MTEDFLLTAEELAEKLRMNVETIRRQTRERKIPHHRVGSVIRYRLGEVLAATQAKARAATNAN